MERIQSDTMQLGDRIKAYEHQFTEHKIDPSLPFIARVDGKAFHTYTKRMHKPFDYRFIKAMQETAKKLTETFDPILTYVQSDEITLLFKPTTEAFLSGKLSKMNSIIASTATYWFSKFIDPETPTVGLPLFDCRVFNVPDEWEAVNALRFRYRDAVRNAVSAAARYKVGHKKCNGLNTDEKLKIIGSDWKGYPTEARYGTFYHRVNVVKAVAIDRSKLKPEVAVKIPDTCIRTEIQEFYVKLDASWSNSLPYKIDPIYMPLNSPSAGIDDIKNATDVIFRGEDAVLYANGEEPTET